MGAVVLGEESVSVSNRGILNFEIVNIDHYLTRILDFDWLIPSMQLAPCSLPSQATIYLDGLVSGGHRANGMEALYQEESTIQYEFSYRR